MNSEIVDKAIEVTTKIIGLLDDKARILYAPEEGATTININIQCENVGQLIGKGGRVLEAVQHLVQRIVSRSFVGKEIESIIIDVGGYRRRREEELSKLAKEIAERVSQSGKSELLQPMSPWERRIVHMAVKQSEDLESKSEDSVSGRRVRIKPKSEDHEGGLEEDSKNDSAV